MLKAGFSLAAAVELQHLNLKACQEDYARRVQLGARHGAIVQAWRIAPPEDAAPAGETLPGGTWNAARIAQLRRELGYEDAPETEEGAS